MTANSKVSHNEVSSFQYTGISAGWAWGYGHTATRQNEITNNLISAIGLGQLSDLGCVYHLGNDTGTLIARNVCSNVSSYSYGGNGYYLDEGSEGLLVTENIAFDVKCAGFMENYALMNNISNNVFSDVSTNKFTPGAEASGLACSCAATSMHRVGALGSGDAGVTTVSTHGRFIFEKNIVHESWRGGGGSVLDGTRGMFRYACLMRAYVKTMKFECSSALKGQPLLSTHAHVIVVSRLSTTQLGDLAESLLEHETKHRQHASCRLPMQCQLHQGLT